MDENRNLRGRGDGDSGKLRQLPFKKPQLDFGKRADLPANFYLPDSPSPEAKSSFTFGTTECLHMSQNGQLNGEEDTSLKRSSSFLSQKSRDADSISFFRAAPAFGRSRRMSQSLPELRDIQFVSVLPGLEEEEESEVTEFPDEVKVFDKPTRVPWHRKLDFILCSVCQSLGLSNFWRFPYYCYSNGGGAFLLAYLVLLLVCAVPLLCMEFAVGQLTQSGPISAFGQLCPLMKGIGVASMMLSFWVTAYYSVLVSWTLFYIFNSFYSPPRWTRCSNTWNTARCSSLETNEDLDATTEPTNESITLSNETTAVSFMTLSEIAHSVEPLQNISSKHLLAPAVIGNHTIPAVEFVQYKILEASKGIGEAKELRFELLAAVVFVWVLTYFALRKTDFFRRTTIYVLTIVSHLLLFSIFLRTLALDGAKEGLHVLFKPEWADMANARLWLYALAQAFHSLGVVLGPGIVMGSCHKVHNNLLRDSIVLAAVTLVTVVLVSCVTFGTLGHLALTQNKTITDVLSDDPSTVFIIYSVVIGYMPVPSCWGVIFFLIFLCLGLDSQIKLMVTLVSALKEAYTYYIKQRFQGHSVFLAAISGVCFFATIPYLTQAGIYFMQLVDHYVAVVAVTVVSLFEMCTLSWLYGSGNLTAAIQQMTGKAPSSFYKLSWMVLGPCSIIAVLGFAAFQMGADEIRQGYTYPQWAHITGWIVFSLTLCWIPLLAVAAYRKAPKSHLFSRLSYTLQARPQSPNQPSWKAKPVLIFNGSMANDSEFPDYKMEMPSSANSVQSYGMERHSTLSRQNDETNF